MPYSETASHSSLGVIDYNDLDMTFTRDALPNKQTADSFKFSLKSIDEGELDIFRRSLVTPMSVNNVQDPIYAEFEKSRNFHKQYMVYNTLKRAAALSPTHSSVGSVADSLAVFNRFIDDHSSDDFVRGDLNDFMSPYNMDDLISLPQSRSPTTPSPQMGRATVAKSNTMAPIGSKRVQTTMVNNNTYVKPRKVSIDACVQTPSCFDDTKPVSPNRSNSKERYRNLKNPKQEPVKTLQPKQSDARRSSYLPEKKPERPTTTTTSKLAQLSNRSILSAVNKTHAEPTTTTAADMNKKSSNVTQVNRAPLLSGLKLKSESKRNSTAGYNNRKSLKEELSPVLTPVGRGEYLQRRLALMTDADERATPIRKEQHQQQQQQQQQQQPQRDSSECSNTTTSSSRSDDVDCSPSTPPDRAKSGYLNKHRDMYDPSSYQQRQRVVSEDNRQYKDRQRKCVTESAREVLAHVQERRARNAIILNTVQYR
ncbi:hypothetical protein HPULCUR_008506 [Helicostylum pulchrum]|uniref:Uncharacterized protein n=1 Tax=Helicostylum pulchrum TaxID=562976 RepID=A0ABP9Y7T1_9FUNG